jgi:hypothetical protein
VLHEGVVRFALAGASNRWMDTWMVGGRTAQLTPDGQHLVFQSPRRLTTSDNYLGCFSGSKSEPCEEVYIYDAASGRVSCVSCIATGLHTANANELPALGASITHTPRVVSVDGDRVFYEAIIPGVNDHGGGVYEWERRGTGSCSEGRGSPFDGGGCQYLIAREPAVLLEADANGENVFFVADAELAASDRGASAVVLYDARVGGGFPAVGTGGVAPPQCESAEACKPPPSEPPIEPFPASAAFSGSGNLALPAEEKPGSIEQKPKPAPAKCGRGRTRKGGRCVKAKNRKKQKRVKKRAKTRAKKAVTDRRAR